MKHLPISFLILLLFVSDLHAQDYNALLPGQKIYFINRDGYLKGMRIDSVRTQGTDVLYFPFRTPRGNYMAGNGPMLDTTGGSWLGSRIIRQADGTMLFDNHRHDTLIIKTLAQTGDSWILYDDTGTVFFKATVTAMDSTTIDGALDSVKYINLSVHNASGSLISHPLNKYSMALSRDHGLVQAFDFWNFPYYTPGGLPNGGQDYYLDMCSPFDTARALFSKTNIYVPDSAEVYDLSPGDVLQFAIPHSSFVINTRTDSILSRTNTASGMQYVIKRRSAQYGILPGGGGTGYTVSFNTVPFYVGNGPTKLLDTVKMPEEWYNPKIYYYLPFSDKYCTVRKRYRIKDSDIFRNGQINNFEPCGATHGYDLGLGETYTYICTDPSGPNYLSYLTYLYRNGTACGTYMPQSVTITGPVPAPVLFPNPAGDLVTVRLPDAADKGPFEVQCTDISGRTVYRTSVKSGEFSIPVAGLPTGLYLLQCSSDNQRYQAKLVVQR